MQTIVNNATQDQLYLGKNYATMQPVSRQIGQGDSFVIGGDRETSVLQFVELVLHNRIEQGTGFFFIDNGNDGVYLCGLKLMAKHLGREQDLLIKYDFNFDIAECLALNKMVYIALDASVDNTGYLDQFVYDLRHHLLEVLKAEEKELVSAVFTNSCEAIMSERWGHLHEVGNMKNPQLNIVHVSERPEQINNVIISNTKEKVLFKLDETKLTAKESSLNYIKNLSDLLNSLGNRDYIHVTINGEARMSFR